MRKFLALLISAVMLFTCAAIPAYAEDKTVFVVSTVNDVKPGETVSVPVTLSGADYEANGLTLHVDFDAARLTLTDVTEGGVIEACPESAAITASHVDEANANGSYVLSIVSPDSAFTGLGTLFTLEFIVNENCDVNQALIISIDEFYANSDSGRIIDINASKVDGAVNISAVKDPTELDAALNVEGGTIHFESEGDYPWEVAEESGDNPRVYAKSSNESVNSSSSVLTATVTAADGDILSFDYQSWGENANYSDNVFDYFEFKLDGESKLKLGAGHETWEEFTIELTAGEHILEWSYTKDSSLSKPGDHAFLDNVAITSSPVVTTDDLDTALNVEGGTIHFESEGDYPWEVVTEDGDGGRCYAKSTNEGVSSSTSVVTATVTAAAGAVVSFDFQCWGEGSSMVWDGLKFYINDVKQAEFAAGHEAWEQFTAELPETGEYILTWEYSKDSSINKPGDHAFLDNVAITSPIVLSDLDRALNVEGGTIHFESEGDYPWEVVAEEGEGARFYAKSTNEGVSSSSSVVTATVTAAAGDVVSFDFQCWGEGITMTWDGLKFYINGEKQVEYASGHETWESFRTTLPESGEYILKWEYSKDSSIDKPGDHAFLDNVYVGEPVSANQIIVDESVTVYVNRTESISWTVLPESADDKNVILTCADESIATVNENGVVFGVAEGVTTVKVELASNPNVFATCTVNVVDMGFTPVDFYAMLVFGDGNNESAVGNWINFSDTDPAQIQTITAYPSDSYAAAYVNGMVYGYKNSNGGGNFWYAPIDNLGNVTVTDVVYQGNMVDMAYDYSRSQMYGLASNASDARVLVKVNIKTGQTQEIASFGSQTIITLAISESGAAYGLAYSSDSNAKLYSIDLDTGALTLIGGTGVPINYVQSMCYDFDNGDLYWAQINSVDNASFYRIDKDTAAVTDLGMIGGDIAEICGLFMVPADEPISSHILTINYAYADGTIAADPYAAELDEGAEYSVASPVITGYTADMLVVEGIMGDEDVTYTVTYTKNVYTVTFVDGFNGETIDTQSVEYGSDAVAPAIPEHEGYHFVQWDTDFTNVTSDLTVTAIYEINKYNVHVSTSSCGTASPLGDMLVEHGSDLTITMTPDANHYVWYVTVNGEIAAVRPGNVITIENITEDIDVFIVFNTDAPEATPPAPAPTPGNPPKTGAVSMTALAIMAIASGAGIVIFRKK